MNCILRYSEVFIQETNKRTKKLFKRSMNTTLYLYLYPDLYCVTKTNMQVMKYKSVFISCKVLKNAFNALNFINISIHHMRKNIQMLRNSLFGEILFVYYFLILFFLWIKYFNIIFILYWHVILVKIIVSLPSATEIIAQSTKTHIFIIFFHTEEKSQCWMRVN